MKLYKLTDKNNYTKKNTKWGKGKTLRLQTCENPQLCTSDVVHAYRSINLGLLLNPNHSDFDPVNLWEAKGEVVVEEYDKVGCFSLTTMRRLKKPEWYTSKSKRRRVQVLFAILCAEAVLKYYENFFPDDKRPRKAIVAAKEYVQKPTPDRAADAARAARAADAARAAYGAARAARAARAAYCADAAVAAADAAAHAAHTAAEAAFCAEAAAHAAEKIDFIKIADEAVLTYDK